MNRVAMPDSGALSELLARSSLDADQVRDGPVIFCG